jgi:hypothetical protein
MNLWAGDTMIGIVFSLNRAMQLDCTLRSFLMHCRDPEEVQLYIIYKARDSRNEQQYQQLMREYSGYSFIHFAKQKDFRRDLLGLLLEHATGRPIGNFYRALLGLGEHLGLIGRHLFTFNGHSYVMFLVDDNLFIGKFSLSQALEALEEHRDAIGFSLRLGANITYCYPLNKNQSIPAFAHLGKHMLKFNWTASDCDFGYPLEVSSSIYRLDELLPLLCSLPFENPNRLEERMAIYAPRDRKSVV